jgi:hypothetical protein
MDNINVRKKVFDVLTGLSLEEISGLEVAIALNGSGVPFGDPGLNLLHITRDDISRAFFLRNATDPLTTEKILSVLVKTGVIDTSGNNVSLAYSALSPLPDSLTPTSLADALSKVLPGPSVGSLKAMCIAATRGITPNSLVDINIARQEALLQSVKDFEGTSFVQKLAKMDMAHFQRIFADIPFTFPMSIYDLIPILAIEFEVDDKVWLELFASFVIPRHFVDLTSMFGFLSIVAQTISSKQSVVQTIKNCASIKQGDFVFDQVADSIGLTLKRFNIVLPSNEAINKQIANALKVAKNYNYADVLRVLGDKEIQTTEELTFLLLATGLMVASTQTSSTTDTTGAPLDASLSNIIQLGIRSPTRLGSDIIQNSLTIKVLTRQSTSSGIKSTERIVVQDGIVSNNSTVTITLNDFTQTLEISILRIGGFIEGLEAIDKIEVYAEYSTAFSTKPHPIPLNLISIKS